MGDFRKRCRDNMLSGEIIYYKLLYFSRFMIVIIIVSILTNEFVNYIQIQLNFITSRSHIYKSGKALVNYGIVSSVWCKKDPGDNNHRTCLFKNLCWLPSEEQFVFLLSEESILVGVEDRRDLSSIDFSSVAGHNRFLLKLTVITTPIGEKHPLARNLVYEESEWVYLMWRFKPDNIMHVLHDDLLPLYYSYEEICGGDLNSCVDKYKLIFVDDVPSDSSYDLYKMFSNGKSSIGDGGPVFIKKHWRQYPNSIICFRHARIGLSRQTTWFDYGFGKPQGAIVNSNLSLAILRKFAQFVMQQLGIPLPGLSNGINVIPPKALYISRSISRRVLNEEDIINSTKKVYSEVAGTSTFLSVDYFNPAPNTSSSRVKDMLKILMERPAPRLIFGMHGAALTVASLLCLATKVGSYPLAIMELFPMGIDPVAVSPIRALINLPWLENSNQVVYESWVNQDPSNSIMPSISSDPLQGGGHMCKGLKLSSTLRAVPCCHNREYLCRMFQDTKVDVEGVYSEKLRSLFLQQGKFKERNAENHLEFQWYFPAPVTNVKCTWNLASTLEKLELSWEEPLNTFNRAHHYVAAVTLKSEDIKEADLEMGHLNDFSSKNLQGSTSQTQKDFFMQISSPEAHVIIPREFLDKSTTTLKAIIWVQCVVVLDYMDNKKHLLSLDTYHECSIYL